MPPLPTSCGKISHSQITLEHHKYQSTYFLFTLVLIFINTLLTSHSLCKSLIRKLLIKDEHRRLGARAGASDIKGHPFFRTTQWALIRHMKPPIVPHADRGIDTVNFRNVKESQSVDISGARPNDPFLEFNSVTLHHDGDDHLMHTQMLTPTATASS
jgi:hypothetical protein